MTYRIHINYKVLSIGFGLLAAVALVREGFGSTSGVIDNCEAIVKRWVTAEYWNPWDEDFWSEPASEVNNATTLNGEYHSGTNDVTNVDKFGVHWPPLPRRWLEMKKESHFNGFKKHTTTELIVFNYNKAEEKTNHFSEPISKNAVCISKLSQTVRIKTWYGITYGSDF